MIANTHKRVILSEAGGDRAREATQGLGAREEDRAYREVKCDVDRFEREVVFAVPDTGGN
jgi:hypothetical protein